MKSHTRHQNKNASVKKKVKYFNTLQNQQSNGDDCTTEYFKDYQIKTRTSAALPERDRRCDRGEPVVAAAAAAAAIPCKDGRSGCSTHSSSVRKVDIRIGLEAGPIDGLTPDLTMDHSTLFNREELAPSPKSN